MRVAKVAFIFFILLGISSCDLIDRYGCTTPDATNFDEKANTNDGSCNFTSSGIFFWNAQTNNYFVTNGVTTIDIMIGDQKVVDNADISLYDYNNNPQSCAGTTWPFFSTLISESWSADTHVEVFNQSDSLVISDVVELSSGCYWYELSPY